MEIPSPPSDYLHSIWVIKMLFMNKFTYNLRFFHSNSNSRPFQTEICLQKVGKWRGISQPNRKKKDKTKNTVNTKKFFSRQSHLGWIDEKIAVIYNLRCSGLMPFILMYPWEWRMIFWCSMLWIEKEKIGNVEIKSK